MNKKIPNDNNERDLQAIQIQVSYMSINLIFDCVKLNKFERKFHRLRDIGATNGDIET